MLSVVDELAAEPARLLRAEEEGVFVERSMVSRSRFVVRVFLYLQDISVITYNEIRGLQSGAAYLSQGVADHVWEVPPAEWPILQVPTAQVGPRNSDRKE